MLFPTFLKLFSSLLFSNFLINNFKIVRKNNKKEATIIADHSWRPARITYRCAEDMKVWAFGISAIDNDDAYNSYKDMSNAFGK